MINKMRTAAKVFHDEGLSEFCRAVQRNILSHESLLLYRCRWSRNEIIVQNRDGLHFFLAEKEYLPVIVRNWPAEFNRMGRNASKLEETLLQRWDRGVRCFVAERKGVFCGAVWVEDWRWGYGQALGGGAVGKIYEQVNGFTTPNARGFGIAGELRLFIGQFMLQEGYEVALSRVRKDRCSSIAMLEKCGFKKLGGIVTGTFMGREFISLRFDT